MGRKVGYARVSTGKQDTDMQLKLLKEAGCEIIFQDIGISGKKKSRPEFDKCLAFLEAGDQLIVYKMDRFGRGIVFVADLVEKLLARGVIFKSLTESFDMSTPVGKLMFNIMASFAQFERENTVQRIKDGLDAAKARGKKLGRRKTYADISSVEEGKLLGMSDRQIYRRLKNASR